MLGIWRSHAEYQKLVREAVGLMMQTIPQSVTAFAGTILKLYHLDLDTIRADFATLFPIR